MKKLMVAIALLVFATSIPATAEIIGGTVTGGTALVAGGTFVKLSVPLSNPFGPPNSVGNDTFQSPNLFGFDEDQNILLAAPLTVDVGSSPNRREHWWRATIFSLTLAQASKSSELLILMPMSLQS
jgi:hypothetical protein